ncbi:DUF167 domain-containing protein [Candidatus Nitrospira allomarina]|jgi:uncharacterized protein|uniref:UPF0235 protein PP769_01380 n=1 Tax=Candidatus Nitrospira allomarina TaxID=3020900 RepID=A0AA96JWY4_9BACT|nr:DUF167 family protein [Candidatus Nitrospira allomarina]WNM58441.1 DUF167 family protein [Candidatus Nitrospira allomarina]
MEWARCLIEKSEGMEIRIYIQPRASKAEIVGLHGEALKIRIASPPVDGQANAELCRFLARLFGIPRQYVQLKSGFSSRQKRIFIEGKTLSDVAAVLTESLSLKNSEHP